jgi:uncharacterized protein YecE (DUF72 family)
MIKVSSDVTKGKQMAQIVVGISAWADPELLQSGFYPPGLKTGAERLQYYASRFSIAELDSSYHFLPSQTYYQNWLNIVPSGFIFDIKAFSLLTQHPTPITSIPCDLRGDVAPFLNKEGHLYPQNLPPELMDTIWERFGLSLTSAKKSGKLGLISFQFPAWFHANPNNYAYIRECRQRLSEFRLGVEFRTPGWLTEHLEESLLFLRENRISLICVDEPQGLKSSLPAVSEFTANPGVVRFHGRNKQTWDDKNLATNQKFNYLYSQNELNEWIPKIRALAEKSEEVYVLFKNKHRDYAVLNADMMKRLLGFEK